MDENINESNALEVQRAEYEQKIEKMKLDFAVETALLKAGARNVRAAAALLDRDKITIGENGEAVGLDEQVGMLKEGEDTAFLFEKESPLRGMVPYRGANVPEGTEKMTYSHFCELYGN